MSSLFFWFVYFILDDVCKIKALFMSPVSRVFCAVVTVGNWTQKHAYNESIHSIILVVHVLKAEHQHFPFLFKQIKLDKDLMLSP